jgi:MFS transporter, DHA1 family, inner membrane transport protein
MSMSVSSVRVNLPAAVASIIGLRTVINIAFRAPIPFLTYIAAAYGADTSSIGWLGVAFSVAGLLGPVAGLLERSFSRRGATLVSMLLFAGVCFAMPFAPSLALAGVLFVLLGVAKALYEPQSVSFVSEHVPYERRGTVVGLIELAWALSWIIGVPMFGFLIERVWWLPFVVTGAATLLGLVFVLRFASHGGASGESSRAGFSMRDFGQVLRARGVWQMLGFGGLIIGAAQIVSLIFAPWLQMTFRLSAAELGIAATVIGVADLLAELATVAFIDRIGKRRSLIGGSVLYALSAIFFWLVGSNFVLALVGLFLVFFFFEYTLVTSLTVQSELVPDNRATMAGFGMASHSAARIVLSLIALPLFGDGRLWLPMLVGAGLVLLAMVVGWQLGAAPPQRGPSPADQR